jgi:transposase
MAKLSDTQLVILAAACERDDRGVYPLTAKVSGGALEKVLKSLLAKGLIEEVPAGLGDTVWRSGEDGSRYTLRATSAALDALGTTKAATNEAAVPARKGSGARRGQPAAQAATRATMRSKGKGRAARAKMGDVAPAKAKATPRSRTGTKQEQLIAMLRRKDGATVEDVVRAFGWQAHTVRGAISGALKKKLKLKIVSEKVEGRGRVYRIAD